MTAHLWHRATYYTWRQVLASSFDPWSFGCVLHRTNSVLGGADVGEWLVAFGHPLHQQLELTYGGRITRADLVCNGGAHKIGIFLYPVGDSHMTTKRYPQVPERARTQRIPWQEWRPSTKTTRRGPECGREPGELRGASRGAEVNNAVRQLPNRLFLWQKRLRICDEEYWQASSPLRPSVRTRLEANPPRHAMSRETWSSAERPRLCSRRSCRWRCQSRAHRHETAMTLARPGPSARAARD